MLDWERFVVSRETLVEVFAGPDGAKVADLRVPGDLEPSPSGAVSGAVMPAWCEGFVVAVLSSKCRRIITVLTAAEGALSCRELADQVGGQRLSFARVEPSRLLPGGPGWVP
ncbi:hypothetical protein ACN6LM_002588 [Streptomyces sp. SAS_281]|uniref:hypothetical protein n=1 Tax=Streptomyces sp. SAS_281 TaxID=3412744 RepID=UPI00403CACDE